ncbi:hypothetical protein [Flavobacterium sp.]|uniref:hypothetical protein n=1 Tax=Flavobacterium sp. TaxID=239 RepID=UPI00262A26E7|nr:hypothetical protein [Flavobacterium sp.]
MKKFLLTFATILACNFYASAQETPKTMDDQNENAQDKIQQEPPRPAQTEAERNARITAEREKVQRESEKNAKPIEAVEKPKKKPAQKK